MVRREGYRQKFAVQTIMSGSSNCHSNKFIDFWTINRRTIELKQQAHILRLITVKDTLSQSESERESEKIKEQVQ